MYHKIESIPVVLIGTSSQAAERASRLAAMLDCTLITSGKATGSDALRLVVLDSHVELRGSEAISTKGITADFSSIHSRPQRGGIVRKQPLGRAIGVRAKTVIDATAGLGQDAFLLACMGYEVLAIERSPIVAALLEDGIRRAENDAILARVLSGRLRCQCGDARELLQNLVNAPDVVYLDPMFPPKRRASALPRKEIQLLRQVVGNDDDMTDVFRIACDVAAQRVVMKRPMYASPVALPTTSIQGKLVRYDVFVLH